MEGRLIILNLRIELRAQMKHPGWEIEPVSRKVAHRNELGIETRLICPQMKHPTEVRAEAPRQRRGRPVLDRLKHCFPASRADGPYGPKSELETV
jgi:hypothetical protein